MNTTGQPFRIIGGHATDIYFIPTHLVKQFVVLAQLFLKHSVFVESTIITLLTCLDQDHMEISTYNIWDSTRRTPWVHFDKFIREDRLAFHPTKWSMLLRPKAKNFTKCVTFYCQTVFDFLHETVL